MSAEITDAMLREQFGQTCLARLGMSFEEAIDIPSIRLTLTRAAEAALAAQARQAVPLSIHHNQGIDMVDIPGFLSRFDDDRRAA